MSDTKPYRSGAICETLRDLLSNKHLYQSCELPKYLDRYFTKRPTHKEWEVIEREEHILKREWTLVVSEDLDLTKSLTPFKAPNIQTYCHRCKERQAFRVLDGHARNQNNAKLEEARYASFKPSQIFYFSYFCQGCQATAVDFLVAQHGRKLTICVYGKYWRR